MSWDKVKNWVFGGGGAVAFVLLMGFIDWRVGVKVDEALASQDIGTDAKIISMDDEIDANAAGVQANKDRGELTQRQLEQVAEILMRPPD